MSVEEAKKELIRAEKSLESANVLLSNGLYEDAISRAYYAPRIASRSSSLFKDEL